MAAPRLPSLDREASTAAAATFAVGLAVGWLVHRHADDIKAAGTKAKDVSSPGRAGGGGGGEAGGRDAAPRGERGARARDPSPRPLLTRSPSLHLPPHPPPQSVSSAFGKLKAKVT